MGPRQHRDRPAVVMVPCPCPCPWHHGSMAHRAAGTRRHFGGDLLPRRRCMNVALWIVAGLLAVVLLVGSLSKLLVPKEKMPGMVGAASRWVQDVSLGALRAIAV